ncbi:flagellar basal body rod protein FlgF [Actibacterium mucosum KCTC 23349]|uniref:Flagellar basal-body rod protein FlgF n=1 Tax=Actibacterium mucosum KCTC 23349 TaxID=1454373 RepID=A0A037ZNV8_9RHOB|nr:flagellar hook-basal body complex protein [Actibacterium mucosum]KAJ57345.1 flagellar basal body rod protein FlgF [Actibacterium mucosum KCTC 23349]
MDNTGYTTLNRQSGLIQELQTVAHNIANLSTTGYKAEGVVFAEVVHETGDDRSLSMAGATVRRTDLSQGTLTATGSDFDMAIEGAGFFHIQTPEGNHLTRAGAFSPDAAGLLSTPDGHQLLDIGGAAIFVPPDAQDIHIAPDGTMSVGGRPLAQIALVEPADPNDLTRRANAGFNYEGALVAVPQAQVIQGFVEGSNVNAVSEVARMIEVQHAYQMGQSFLEREDERIRAVLQTLGQ